MRTNRCLAALPLLVLLQMPATVRAADIFPPFPSAPALELEPSIRAQAMGGAGTAMAWGADPDHWANPALLGLAEGVRYEQGDTDFGFGFHNRTRRTTLGGGGVGVALAGQPFESWGRSELTSPWWVLTGGVGFKVGERVRSWAAGASLGRLTREALALAGREPPALLRHVDLAFGYAERRAELDPITSLVPYPANGTAPSLLAKDWGWLARASLVLRGAPGPVDLDVAFGHAVHNDAQAGLPYFDAIWPSPRVTRNGAALHVGFTSAALSGRGPGWLADGFAPHLALAAATDVVHSSASPSNDAEGWGVELALANVVFGRLGARSDDPGQPARHTRGFGLGLPLGRFGGFRYDRAWSDRDVLPGVTGSAWTAWMEPLALWRALR